MPRILAIDWDRLEARALLLQAGPTGTSVTRAWIVPLEPVDRAAPAGSHLGRQLAAALAGEPLSKTTTIVGVGRDQVQMKLLALPPAPAEELPELVRFQAEREFTALGDDSALDFIPLAGDATTPHQVLAAALAGSSLGEVNSICEALDVELSRVTLRACGAASFVSRHLVVGPNEISLVANRFEDEADLTVLAGDKVVFVRSVRLTDPSDEAARGRALAGEIRRTLAAVRQQLGDQQVGKVVLCGTADDADEATSLAKELGLPVVVFDVAAHAPPGLARAGVPKESVSRLAAVLGMALGEADRRPPVIDFLHVRRRVEERRFTRLHALAAAAAAIFILSFGVHLWRQVTESRDDLAAMAAQTASLEKQGKQYAKVTAQATAIERWLATDVNWLDEIDRLSQKWRPQTLDAKDFSTSADALVTQLTVVRPPGNGAKGGRLDVQAVAKDAAAVATLEERLRDADHRVATAGGKQEHTVPGYDWSFGLRMDVTHTTDAGGGGR
jgi:Tfp pilus assembly PilM family ATPase